MIAALLLTAAAPIHWSQPPISSARFESHPALDPRTGDLWFVRSAPDFSGWRLKVSRCTRSGWGVPTDPPFAAPGVEADPWFAPDGRSLWFISTRATGSAESKDLDIWRVARDRRGRWAQPERLPAPINSDAAEWFPRLDRDGWLYFGSRRAGGFGGNDIWRARREANGWTIENAGPALNTAGEEYEALPSPDGRHLLLNASDGYYLSTRRGDGHWSPRVRLGPEINANGSEVGALYSPSGKSWLFARDLKGTLSGELMLVSDGEKWPSQCPNMRSKR